ncbi:hypothetical protein EDB84DRAFT_641947 [Lactarius hengduanensis]|nr:hypothetical protein EDB84DRAFT_641947 [Lactarius hengduanensis]
MLVQVPRYALGLLYLLTPFLSTTQQTCRPRRHLRPLPPLSFRHLALRRHFDRYRYRAVPCGLSLSRLSSRSRLSPLSHLSYLVR